MDIIQPQFVRAVFRADWVNPEQVNNPLFNMVYKSTKDVLVIDGLDFKLEGNLKLSTHNNDEVVFTLSTIKGVRILPTINLKGGKYTLIVYSQDNTVAKTKANRVIKFVNSLKLQQQQVITEAHFLKAKRGI